MRRLAETLRLSFLFLSVLGMLSFPTRAVASDADGDGVDDDVENYLAARFLPPIYASWTDGCLSPLNPKPVVFRARYPNVWGVVHTEYMAINYVILYDLDCGFNGHSGDAESFLVFLQWNGSDWQFASESATAHWGAQACEQLTASYWPGIIVGNNKHGNHTNSGECGCDNCTDSTYQLDVALYNAGEPSQPIVNNLGVVNYDWVYYWVWSGNFYGDDPGPIYPMMYITNYYVLTKPPEWNPCISDCSDTYYSCVNYCNGDQLCASQCEDQAHSCQASCDSQWHWNTT